MSDVLVSSIGKIAEGIARALVRVTTRGDSVRLSLPMTYPGGSMVGVELANLRDGFLVTDGGSARREAGLMGGERAFRRIALDVAKRHGIRFDSNMMFDVDVAEAELVSAVVAVANAARSAVENTAVHLAAVEHADHRAYLWDRLEIAFGQNAIGREPVKVQGASSDALEFDAGISVAGKLRLFEIVTPQGNSVNSAVAKFLDVSDLGDEAPGRVAVLTNKDRTPRLVLLSRNALLLRADAPEEEYRTAA